MNEQQQAAMRQALEALSASDDFLFNYHDCEPNNEREVDAYSEVRGNNMKAWEAIREVLAEQPAQEPVFKFQMQLKPGWGSQYPTPCVIGDPDLRSLFGKVGDVVTFYTSPQPAQSSKPWVGLTEWERGDCVDRGVARGDGWAAILEEVEAKLREKNTGEAK